MKPKNLLELDSLALKDPLAYGIGYIDLLDGRKWDVDTRRWAIEPYQAGNPYQIEKNPAGLARRIVLQKPTQIGMSTLGMVKLFHFADYWSVRIGYSLPRQQDVIDMVTTRINPMIQQSKRLKGKLGDPDSTHAKRIGSSYIYFMEASVEARMLPMDALFVDEIDLSDQDNVSTMQNRLDASRWKMMFFFSTPTLPNYGINGLYLNSDQRKWFVKCPSCGHYQVLDWEKHLRVEGNPNDPKKVYFGCERCDRVLDLPTIQQGQWVAEYPEKSATMVGYSISQLMTHPATDLYAAFRDPQTKIVEFYRKRLGIPYEIGGGSLERDDFILNCFDDPYTPEFMTDGKSSYYMGLDQGNELQCVIARLDKGTNKPKIVHIEVIPYEKGFERAAQLMRLFKIRRAVFDADPNRHAVRTMQDDFKGRIIMADYTEQKERWATKKTGGIVTNAVIGRTEGMDDLMQSIKDGYWSLYGDPGNLSPEVETLIDQVTSLRRDVETRRTPSGEQQVGVWRKLRADHFAHAMLYCKTAIEIDRGKAFRVVVIGKSCGHKELIDVDQNQPTKEELVEIISLMSEVPLPQLEEFIEKGNQPEYEMPFPLSYKYRLAKNLFRLEKIRYTIIAMIRNHSSIGRTK